MCKRSRIVRRFLRISGYGAPEFDAPSESKRER